MNSKQTIFRALFYSMILLLAACSNGTGSSPLENKGSSSKLSRKGTRTGPTISVNTSDNLTINGLFKGYGVQDDSHMLWDANNKALGVVTPQDYDSSIRPRLQAMKVPLVRKFISVAEFAPSPGVYNWNSEAMQGLYYSLGTLRDMNTEVMLTIWRLPSWLSPTQDFPVNQAFADDQWATVVADLMKHLRGADGSGLNFSNVKYLGSPNELESASVASLVEPYRLLKQKLDNAGIGGLQLFGPDAYTHNNNGGSDAISQVTSYSGLNSSLGFYDWHLYTDGGLGGEGTAIAGYESIRNVINGSGKQAWLTEFGDTSQANDNWTVIPALAIDAANHGQAAILIWELLEQSYGGGVLDAGRWGMIRYKNQGYSLKPSFYAYSMLTSHIERDSRVLNNSCAFEQCNQLRVSTFSSPGGLQTVLVYNLDGNNDQVLTFNYSDRGVNQRLYKYVMNPAQLPGGANGVGFSQTVDISGGSFSDTVPAGSFVVYSAVNPYSADNGRSSSYFRTANNAIFSVSGSHYCGFGSWDTYIASGGSPDVAGTVPLLDPIPSTLVNDGVCGSGGVSTTGPGTGGGAVTPTGLPSGYFRNSNNAIYFATGTHYCGFDSWDKYLASGGNSNVQGTVPVVEPIPSSMVSDGVCGSTSTAVAPPPSAGSGTTALPSGYFRNSSNAIYYATGTHYCGFDSWDKYLASGGNSNVQGTVPVVEPIPSSMVSDGVCGSASTVATPAAPAPTSTGGGTSTLPSGYFRNSNNAIYFATGTHYCGFDSWDKYLASGGNSNVQGTVPVVEPIPSSMVSDGVCGSASTVATPAAPAPTSTGGGGTPASSITGYFRNPSNAIFYSNGSHYCFFDSWDKYISSGGNSDVQGTVPVVDPIPNSLVGDGACR